MRSAESALLGSAGVRSLDGVVSLFSLGWLESSIATMARKALLCGINAYIDQPLNGCVNDALNLQKLLQDHCGFAQDQIQLLLDHDCIRSKLLQGWSWLTEGARPGDVLVFSFSGHGSYIPDQDGDESDLRDEITCLQNFDFSDPDSYLSDDEWFILTQAVPEGVHLLILKDTCHSGGSSRFIGVRRANGQDKIILANTHQLSAFGAADVIPETAVSNSRFIVPPQLPAEAWQRSGTPIRQQRGPLLMHTSLMACSEAQTAADDFIEGSSQGAFTHSVCTVLRQGSAASSDQLIAQVATLMSGRYSQIPQHEGPVFDLSLLVDSDTVRPVTVMVPSLPGPYRPGAIAPQPPRQASAGTSSITEASPQPSPQQMVYEAHLRFLETMRALNGSS